MRVDGIDIYYATWETLADFDVLHFVRLHFTWNVGTRARTCMQNVMEIFIYNISYVRDISIILSPKWIDIFLNALELILRM